MAGNWLGLGTVTLIRPQRVSLQELSLVLGQPAHLRQLRAHHLPGSLLGGFAARPLPDPHHRRRVGHHEAVHSLDQVVLKPRPPELTVGKDADARRSLPLQRVQNGTVFHFPQFRGTHAALLKSAPGLFDLNRPQQAPDVVCTVNPRHGSFPPTCLPDRGLPAYPNVNSCPNRSPCVISDIGLRGVPVPAGRMIRYPNGSTVISSMSSGIPSSVLT